MRNSINGSGHFSIIPDGLIPNIVVNEVFQRANNESPIYEISQAQASFEDALLCGRTVTWLDYDVDDDNYWQSVQNNEEPELSNTQLTSKSIRICGNLKIREKLDIDALRELECNGLDSLWFTAVKEKMYENLRKAHVTSHFATVLAMVAPENMGGNAGDGSIDLGTVSNPLEIPFDSGARKETLLRLFEDLKLVLSMNNALVEGGDPFWFTSTMVGSASSSIFVDQNMCCGRDNVKYHGQMEKTIYGFDTYVTNEPIMQALVNGKRLHYILVGNKRASGFVHDIYNVKWLEKEDHFVLTGTEAHGSYVTRPWELAVAVVTFEGRT